MAQGKDHIWGGIPLEAEHDESMVDEHSDRYLGTQRISMKKREALQKRWLMAEWGQQKKKDYMDFGFMVCSKSLFYKVLYVIFIILLVIGFVVLIVEFIPKHGRAPPAPDDFTLALQKALLFFDAQKSGVLPEDYSISYRRTSGLKDGILPGGQTVDLTGGLYDSGNNIKFGFPAAFTTTLLSWSVIEYNAKYRAAGELDHVKEIIRWSTDYLLKTLDSSNTHVQQLYAQVGEGGISNPPKENDGFCWQRPEDMDYTRVVASCSSAPELGAETAAALAAASIVFRADKQYASALVVAAQKVFAFATDPGKRTAYTASGATDAALFYPSSGYKDEHLWAATWLFFATGNWTFLDHAIDLQLTEAAQLDYANSTSYGIFDWDNKLIGAQMLLTRLLILMDPGVSNLTAFHEYTNTLMCLYLPDFQKFAATQGGLVLFKGVNATSHLHYTVGVAFLSALYADYMEAADIPGWNCGDSFFLSQALRKFSISQLEYILGRNPEELSYVVGFGSRYPQFVHHRAASIPKDGNHYNCTEGFTFKDSPRPNPNVLDGALVGGPDASDRYDDRRIDANSTMPTIASNAGLVAALVAVAGPQSPKGALLDRNTLFSSLTPLRSYPPPPASPSS